MLAFTALAVQVLLWQSQDISVAIVSETESGSNEVIISVRNTAGSTLLFYENAEMTGKIEYLSEEGWIEYCDVSYTYGNASAVSKLYSGTFAELEPGEDWNVSVPEEKVSEMKNGTYRIKMTYVTEKKYNEYLKSLVSSEESDTFSGDESLDESEEISDLTEESIEESLIIDESGEESGSDSFFAGLIQNFGNGEKEEIVKEELKEAFHAESICEIFVKTFEYSVPEDFVSAVSIDDSDIAEESEDPSKRLYFKEERLR
ncbi:MAG: hypothetical protein J6R45_00345 [Clostridia bacterium]|nr:hypothetical protein [Clostridia bacterium]